MSQKGKKTVLSGMRPTGPLHLGNYVGALRGWVRLQDTHRCFFTIVPWHALSSEYQNPKVIREYTFEVALDWLAAGLDPEKSVLFIQSEVKEHAELHLLLSMITPLPWLERVPTFKEQQQEIADRELNTYGFLGYPLLQTADIIIYKAEVVPVGEDQAFHIELAQRLEALDALTIINTFSNLEVLSNRFDQLEARFKKLEDSLSQVVLEQRYVLNELVVSQNSVKKFDSLEQKVSQLEASNNANNEDIKKLSAQVESLNSQLMTTRTITYISLLVSIVAGILVLLK